jgi:hypothetical protein
MSVLQKTLVLETNRHGVAVKERTVGEAMHLLCKGACRAYQIETIDNKPEILGLLDWEAWIQLYVGKDDLYVQTPHRKILVPKVITTQSDKIPLLELKMNKLGFYTRDNGRCQYTNRLLTYEESTIDHVLPKDQGGETSWENCVLCAKDVNYAKGNKTPEQAGLTLLRKPKKPNRRMKVIQNQHNVAEWDLFYVR